MVEKWDWRRALIAATGGDVREYDKKLDEHKALLAEDKALLALAENPRNVALQEALGGPMGLAQLKAMASPAERVALLKSAIGLQELETRRLQQQRMVQELAETERARQNEEALVRALGMKQPRTLWYESPAGVGPAIAGAEALPPAPLPLDEALAREPRAALVTGNRPVLEALLTPPKTEYGRPGQVIDLGNGRQALFTSPTNVQPLAAEDKRELEFGPDDVRIANGQVTEFRLGDQWIKMPPHAYVVPNGKGGFKVLMPSALDMLLFGHLGGQLGASAPNQGSPGGSLGKYKYRPVP